MMVVVRKVVVIVVMVVVMVVVRKVVAVVMTRRTVLHTHSRIPGVGSTHITTTTITTITITNTTNTTSTSITTITTITITTTTITRTNGLLDPHVRLKTSMVVRDPFRPNARLIGCHSHTLVTGLHGRVYAFRKASSDDGGGHAGVCMHTDTCA